MHQEEAPGVSLPVPAPMVRRVVKATVPNDTVVPPVVVPPLRRNLPVSQSKLSASSAPAGSTSYETQAKLWSAAPPGEAAGAGHSSQEIAVLKEEVKNIKQELKGATDIGHSPTWPPRPAGKLGNVFYVPRSDCADPTNNVIFASWEVVLRHKWHGAVEGFTDINKAREYLPNHRRVGEYRIVFT